MSTYAAPIDPLWTGMMIPGTNTPMSGYYAEFLVPGTSTRKNAYDDASKQVAVQTKALNSSGRAQTFGDGVYDIKFYAGDPDADPALVSVLTLSNYKARDPLGDTRTITQDTTGSVDDELVLGNTTSGNINYTLPDATLVGSRAIIVQKTPSASNTLTVTAASGQQVNGAASVSYTVANSGSRFISDGSNWYAPDYITNAGNADTVDNFDAAATPTANKILVADSNAYLPEAAVPGGAGTDAATASRYMKRDANARAKVAEAATSDQIPTLNQVIPGFVAWDQQAVSTDGGTFTSGAWQVRVLNTVHRNAISGASLATNQITLPAGTYYVEASAPAAQCALHSARISAVYTARGNSTAYALNDIRSATASDGEERWYTCTTAGTSDATPPTFPTSGTVADGTVVWTHGGETALVKGTAEWSNNTGGYAQTRSHVRGVFILAAPQSLVIELRHRCSATKATNGLGNGSSFTANIFATISLWKIN